MSKVCTSSPTPVSGVSPIPKIGVIPSTLMVGKKIMCLGRSMLPANLAAMKGIAHSGGSNAWLH